VYERPRILSAGEGGLVVEFSDKVEEPANHAVRKLDAILPERLWAGLPPPGPHVFRAVPTYRSLLVVFDPLRLRREVLLAAIEKALDSGGGGDSWADSADASTGRLVEIPVCYAGEMAPDLPEVARLTGLPEEAVARLHTGREYLVYMLGFQVGYPYMASLPPELRLPRLARPRLRTPRGAVAIAGELAGIYSIESPGGWRVIGNTPLPMWSLDWDPPTLLRPGDRVRFREVTPEAYAGMRRAGWLPDGAVSPVKPRVTGGSRPAAESVRVVRPGLLATVQDLGRPGYERYGLGPGGAMDRFAIRTGNRLAGNDEDSAAVEVTAGGAEFEFLRELEFVWAGGHGQLQLDGQDLPAWTVIRARPGQRLAAGFFVVGFRAYLCLAGGLAVPVVAASRSTNLAAGFGGHQGRALRPGDTLNAFLPHGRRRPAAGRAADPEILAATYQAAGGDPAQLRVVIGPQDEAFTPEGLGVFFNRTYRVGPESNRMGYRLIGESVGTRTGSDIVSDGIVAGAIQVPGNGQPVLLTADHQTTGGYAKLGVVCGADMVTAAQLAPGREVVFREISSAEAVRARLEQEKAVGRAVGELVELSLKIGGRRFDVSVDENKKGREA
jgi:KipI family sensor histidine kinase inhibitor